MRPEETQIGEWVREDHRKTDSQGQEGATATRWGNPTYPALDVLLDDCNLQLFLSHELEEIGAKRGSKRLRYRNRYSSEEMRYS